MFTFHWSELLVIVLGGLALFFGLALLMLRRRNEILQDFLTPEEPNLEVDFFGAREPKPKEVEAVAEEAGEEAPSAEGAPETGDTKGANPETEHQEMPATAS